ncbi:MAG: hypothetical protein ACIAS6_01140 [Phycisphaerales bacterium JB060]
MQPPPQGSSESNPLTPREAIDVLLAEYEAMYRLAGFRMTSLERRVPAAGATIVAFLGVLPLLPESSQWILLVVVPASLVWFVRTTINHARSFEDVLRRIEWIEKRTNQLAGEELLGFQSNHPSRGTTVGGRTGVETVSAVMLASAMVLLACLTLTFDGPATRPAAWWSYYAYLVAVALYLGSCIRGWRRYQTVNT